MAGVNADAVAILAQESDSMKTLNFSQTALLASVALCSALGVADSAGICKVGVHNSDVVPLHMDACAADGAQEGAGAEHARAVDTLAAEAGESNVNAEQRDFDFGDTLYFWRNFEGRPNAGRTAVGAGRDVQISADADRRRQQRPTRRRVDKGSCAGSAIVAHWQLIRERGRRNGSGSTHKSAAQEGTGLTAEVRRRSGPGSGLKQNIPENVGSAFESQAVLRAGVGAVQSVGPSGSNASLARPSSGPGSGKLFQCNVLSGPSRLEGRKVAGGTRRRTTSLGTPR